MYPQRVSANRRTLCLEQVWRGTLEAENAALREQLANISRTERMHTMGTESLALSTIFDGWQGHQLSLVKAVESLTRGQLVYRSVPGLRSVGEIVNHIACG